MKQKTFKILLISSIIILFFSSYSLASDINLNIPGASVDKNTNTIVNNNVNTETNKENSSKNNIENNTENNNTNANTNTNLNEDLEKKETNSNLNNENDFDSTTDNLIESESLQPNQILNTGNEQELKISNIINIILITVGTVLILLSIAILIRIK